jgi:ABC-type thiamin/hydroxymethylpyrimidine transport system permease subunit
MQVARAQQPIAAAAVTLVICIACIASFLPPLSKYTTASVPLVILAGLGMAVSLILHLIFVGVAAKRLGRSPTLWVVIALCGFPIASIIGLILFEWFSDEQNQSPA